MSPRSKLAAHGRKPVRTMPYIVLGLCGLYTLEFGVVGILPMIVDRFGVTTAQAGLLVGMFALIVAACGPFLVLVSSRYDRKTILVCALSGFTLCSLLSAHAPSFNALLVLRILPPLLHPVFFAAAFATAISLYPGERAAHATSLAMVGLILGLIVGVPMMTWIAASLSYEASFLFYAAEYLRRQDGMTGQTISLMLVVFGTGGVSGNLIAGRLLGKHLVQTAMLYPAALAVAYIILIVFGSTTIAQMSLIVLLWCGLSFAALSFLIITIKAALFGAAERRVAVHP